MTMPKWIAAVLVSGWLCAPNLAFALSDQGWSADIASIPKEQTLVVGAGIIAGALVLHLVVPGDFTYFAGGVVGGLAALWWYENGGETKLRPLLKLDRATGGLSARGGPLLDGVALRR
jgi:hypothetical protein